MPSSQRLRIELANPIVRADNEEERVSQFQVRSALTGWLAVGSRRRALQLLRSRYSTKTLREVRENNPLSRSRLATGMPVGSYMRGELEVAVADVAVSPQRSRRHTDPNSIHIGLR